MLRWGDPKYVKLFEKRVREGKPVPALASRPTLLPHLHPVWQAFNELHRRRSSGFGPTPIPVSEIVAWMMLSGVDDQEEREFLYRMVGVLDDSWIAWARSQKKTKKGRENASSSSRDRRQQSESGSD